MIICMGCICKQDIFPNYSMVSHTEVTVATFCGKLDSEAESHKLVYSALVSCREFPKRTIISRLVVLDRGLLGHSPCSHIRISLLHAVCQNSRLYDRAQLQGKSFYLAC